MTNNTEHPWHAKIVGGGPIGDTGDYNDGHWEITNGKQSFFTSDDDQSAASEETEDQWVQLIAALNDCKAKFWTKGDDNAHGLEMERDHYKAGIDDKDKEIERLRRLVKEAWDQALDNMIVDGGGDLSEYEDGEKPVFKSWETFIKQHNI